MPHYTLRMITYSPSQPSAVAVSHPPPSSILPELAPEILFGLKAAYAAQRGSSGPLVSNTLLNDLLAHRRLIYLE